MYKGACAAAAAAAGVLPIRGPVESANPFEFHS